MLSDRERAILAFEETWIDRPIARRELAVDRRFGMRYPRYLQILGGLLDRQDAIAANPQLLYRLRARRERRSVEAGGRLIARDA
jgi:hypothetical protein